MKWISVGDKLIEISDVKEIIKDYWIDIVCYYLIRVDGKTVLKTEGKKERDEIFEQIKKQLVNDNSNELFISKIICPLLKCLCNNSGQCRNNSTIKLKTKEEDKTGEYLDCDNFKWKESE